MDTFLSDVRYAIRTAAKRPGFTATAVATLAVGIGVTSALFSVVNAVLLRPLPFVEADALVAVGTTPSGGGASRSGTSYPDFVDYREQAKRSFEDLAALRTYGYMLATPAGAEPIRGARVSGGFFEILRARAAIGRTFTRDEDRPGGPRLAVIGHDLWQRRFGGDTAVAGRAATISGESYTILGVMPPGFRFPLEIGDAEIWTPLSEEDEDSRKERGMHYLDLVGRLRPNASLEQAHTELKTLALQLEKQYPDSNTKRYGVAVPLHDEIVGDSRRGLLILMGAVLCVLLVACANVANLLLARATEREREVSIRGALGAGRGRLVAQLLTEGIVLAVAGGAVGLALAAAGVRALVALAPPDLPRVDEIGLDWRVVLFTFLASVATGLLFACAPALRGSRVDLARGLSESSRGAGASGGRGRQRLRNALIVAEVALSLVLLTGAGLLLRSLTEARRVDPGFSRDRLLTARVSLWTKRYDKPDQIAVFYRDLLARVRALPGAELVGAVTPLPFGNEAWVTHIRDAALPEPPPSERWTAHYASAEPGYFAAMGIPLRKGRLFTDADVRGGLGAVLVNETLARKYFPGEDPVGKRVKFGIGIDETDEKMDWEIVGIVGDVTLRRLDAPINPAFYVSSLQQPLSAQTVVLRSTLDPKLLAESVRRELRVLDPEIPLTRVRTMAELVDASLGQRRFHSLLLVSFASVGLLLAAIGLYGVMAFAVTLRTREIGIRMALGAERANVLRDVMQRGMGLAGLGTVVGLASALVLARVLSTLLFRVSPTDPPTFGLASLLLLLTALVAAYVPARRATRVDPMVALRDE